MKILEDVFSNIGKHKHDIQISLDILNCLNLFNRNWGVQQQVVSTSPLIYKGLSGGQPTFVLRTNSNGTLLNKTYSDDQSINSTWGMQVGFRYIFWEWFEFVLMWVLGLAKLVLILAMVKTLAVAFTGCCSCLILSDWVIYWFIVQKKSVIWNGETSSILRKLKYFLRYNDRLGKWLVLNG